MTTSSARPAALTAYGADNRLDLEAVASARELVALHLDELVATGSSHLEGVPGLGAQPVGLPADLLTWAGERLTAWAELDDWVEALGWVFAELGASAAAVGWTGEVALAVPDRVLLDVADPHQRDLLGAALLPDPADLADRLLVLLATHALTHDADDLARLTDADHLLEVLRNAQESTRGSDTALADAWQYLGIEAADVGLRPAVAADELAELTFLLDVLATDPVAAARWALELGPAALVALPRLVADTVWIDRLTGGGVTRVDVPGVTEAIAAAFAAATTTIDAPTGPRLTSSYVDEVFALGVTDGVLDDTFPWLFSAGSFHVDVAERLGDLAVDLLDRGRGIEVAKGPASSLVPGIEAFETPWRLRGTLLLEAVARTPAAATAVLTPEVVDWVVTYDDGDAELVLPALDALLVAGAVDAAAADPGAARRAAQWVIDAAAAAGPDRVPVELAPAFGDLVVTWADELVATNLAATDLQYVDPDRLVVATETAARFLALAVRDEPTRRRLEAYRAAFALAVGVPGVLADLSPGDHVPWEAWVGRLHGLWLAGVGQAIADEAEALDARAALVDQLTDLLAGVPVALVPLPPGLNSARPLAGWVTDVLKARYLDRDVGHADRARFEVNRLHHAAHDWEQATVLTVFVAAALATAEPAPWQQDLVAEVEAALGTTLTDPADLATVDPEAFTRFVAEHGDWWFDVAAPGDPHRPVAEAEDAVSEARDEVVPPHLADLFGP